MFEPIIAELTVRNHAPLGVRMALLVVFIIICLLYTANSGLLESIRLLAFLPFQRFSWQSEKHVADVVFRITSAVTTVCIITILFTTYTLDLNVSAQEGYLLYFWKVLSIVGVYFIVKLGVNKVYFYLHRSADLGEQIVDFQYSLNQWFTLVSLVVLLADVFYFRVQSNLFYVIAGLAVIYFLIRLFGTILILQSNFKYPIITLFVYLCTLEIVPALIVAKVLFVNS